MREILDALPTDRADRLRVVNALGDRLNQLPPPPGARVTLPPRFRSALLAHLNRAEPRLENRWMPGRQEDGFPRDGVGNRDASEWWGDARQPGSVYGERLWAWGSVSGPGLGWRWEEGFHPTDALGAFAAKYAGIQRGPGFLLACTLDAIAELVGEVSLTHRDAAALWGGFVLPLLAPPLVVERPDVAPDTADFERQLAFRLLHPSARAALCVMDQLATWGDAGDVSALSVVIGEPVSDPAVAVGELIGRIGRAALRRDAADRWDGGLGFRLVRRVIREIDAAPDQAGAIDTALHGRDTPDAMPGPLATRLREAFGTALTAAESKSPGAATLQLVDLIWLRWVRSFTPGR